MKHILNLKYTYCKTREVCIEYNVCILMHNIYTDVSVV